ncbi:MAG: negative modulator of initiation of replication [Alteromonadaceae bacterium]|jgi:negative modulator of initiation of replication|tara:strand:+ start:2315 stop:2884 length:570 start_codon:yes stop_codon:yes gene_type:complete
MKNIEIDEELYQFIAQNTQFIGESASSILRRLLSLKIDGLASTYTNKNILLEEQELLVDMASPSEVQEINLVENRDINETVFNYVNKEELAMQRGAVGRFLLILAALYRGHSSQFPVVTKISGRDRLYFANTEQELAASGSSTKPRQIPESPFWVMTNSNTTRKKMMLTKVAIALGYSDDDAEKIRELL